MTNTTSEIPNLNTTLQIPNHKDNKKFVTWSGFTSSIMIDAMVSLNFSKFHFRNRGYSESSSSSFDAVKVVVCVHSQYYIKQTKLDFWWCKTLIRYE